MDQGDDGEKRGIWRVGLTLGSGGNGNRGALPHQGLNQEAVGNHSVKGGLLNHL